MRERSYADRFLNSIIKNGGTGESVSNRALAFYGIEPKRTITFGCFFIGEKIPFTSDFMDEITEPLVNGDYSALRLGFTGHEASIVVNSSGWHFSDIYFANHNTQREEVIMPLNAMFYSSLRFHMHLNAKFYSNFRLQNILYY